MKRFHDMTDADRNPQFRRAWKFPKRDRQFDNLPAIEAQRARDLEARLREGVPIPRQTAALFDGVSA